MNIKLLILDYIIHYSLILYIKIINVVNVIVIMRDKLN